MSQMGLWARNCKGFAISSGLLLSLGQKLNHLYLHHHFLMGWGRLAQRGHAVPKLNLTQYLQVLLVLAGMLPALPSVPEGAENGTRMALYTLGFPVSG